MTTKHKEYCKSATRAGLHYVTDGFAGISRRRSGKGWSYYDEDGARIAEMITRERLNALAIPPAWINVWICPDPDGHIQVTARDARGRKQYRYHASYRAARDQSKFRRMLEFSEILPLLRERVELRSARGRPDAAPAARHGGAAAGQVADPRGQRRIRARKPFLRPDDDAQQACAGGGAAVALQLPRQERGRAFGDGGRSAHRPHRAALPGYARAGDISVSGCSRASAGCWWRTT